MPDFNPDLDLRIERVIRGRPETIWRCWEDPELFKRWFVPPPTQVIESENVLESGGRAFNVMRLADGTEHRNEGCFLLVEPLRRVVYSDGLHAGFRPSSEAPFMTVDLVLTPTSNGTTYAAHVMHASADQRKSHLEMGFEDGWGTTIGQLDELVQEIERG